VARPVGVAVEVGVVFGGALARRAIVSAAAGNERGYGQPLEARAVGRLAAVAAVLVVVVVIALDSRDERRGLDRS
jgi:hypothetical protein